MMSKLEQLEEDSRSSNEKITFLTACVFIVGEVAGGGILSLPHAVAQAGKQDELLN